jgi:MFS family permease
MGAYSLGQLIAAPLWGRLSDRIGRKPVLIAGLVGAGVAYVLVLPVASIVALGAVRLLAGLMAGNIGAAFAAAADRAALAPDPDHARARNMGLLGAAFGLGFIVGPALGALAVGAGEPDLQDFHRICLIAAALAFVAAGLALVLFQDVPRVPAQAPATPARTLLRHPLLSRLMLVTVLMIGAQALMETTFGLWADRQLRWGPMEVGLALAAAGLVTAGLQGGGAGRLARRYGEAVVLRAGLCVFVVGFVGLSLSTTSAAALAAMVVLAVGAGLSTPALQSLIAASAAAQDRGAAMGLSQSASALGRVLGPLVSGVAFDGLGPAAPFLLGAVALGAAVILAPRAVERPRQPSA